MSRLLLHPLKDGGNITRTAPGQWAEAQNASFIGDIELTESADQTRRASISSVPTPWARMQVFRDAMLNSDHPFRQEAINDILDSIELLLFQDHLAGVTLMSERIDLESVRRNAMTSHNSGVLGFANALTDLAPVVDRADSRLSYVIV